MDDPELAPTEDGDEHGEESELDPVFNPHYVTQFPKPGRSNQVELLVTKRDHAAFFANRYPNETDQRIRENMSEVWDVLNDHLIGPHLTREFCDCLLEARYTKGADGGRIVLGILARSLVDVNIRAVRMAQGADITPEWQLRWLALPAEILVEAED